ncbi:hypothetical protein MMC25_006420 [Agyrium rufum]|nr:hypothetical protein [Agyrium rufum]
MMITSLKTPGRQAIFGKMLLRDMLNRMFVKQEKSMDLLQGLLIHIAWHQFHPHCAPLTNMIHLAVSLIVDLGLNKSPQAYNQRRSMMDKTNPVYGGAAKPQKAEIRSLEDRRALLGTYYLASLSSPAVRKIEALPFSKYMDECCNVISEAQEYQSDVFLLRLVKLQTIVDRMTSSLPYEDVESGQRASATTEMVIKALQNELEIFKSSLPPQLQQDSVLLLHYYSASMYLNEIALYDFLPHGVSDTTPFLRLTTLYNCLLSAKAFWDLNLSVAPANYHFLPFTLWIQSSHAILLTSKLSFFKACDWDAAHARSIVDLSSILTTLIEQGGKIQDAIGIDRSDLRDGEFTDTFDMARKKFTLIKAYHEARLVAETNMTSRTAPPRLSPTQMMPLAMNAMNEDWMTVGGLDDFDELIWSGYANSKD